MLGARLSGRGEDTSYWMQGCRKNGWEGGGEKAMVTASVLCSGLPSRGGVFSQVNSPEENDHNNTRGY